MKPGLVKGPWQPKEDQVIKGMMEAGVTKWSLIASKIPGRIGKQCRERWFNHLDPSVKKGIWLDEEDEVLIRFQSQIGNKWCKISEHLPGRTENDVKNRWRSSKVKKIVKKMNESNILSKKKILK